jgi:hypothetical protein
MTDLAIVTWPERRRDVPRLASKGFPMLAGQVRCSTGFTYAPRGLWAPGHVVRAEAPPKVVEPEDKWAALEPVEKGSFAAELLGVLVLLANSRAALPMPKALLAMTSTKGNAGYLIAKGFDQLEQSGHLQHVRPPKGVGAGRTITLRHGRVLRSAASGAS